MTLKAKEIELLAGELSGLAGRSVQKVIQPDAHTVVLGLGKRWLLLSAAPDVGRFHSMEKPPGSGAHPPAFCMLLRKHLLNTRLIGIRAIPGERAAELSFSGGLALWLFLYGKSAQLVLVDDGKPLGAIGPARTPHTALPPPKADAGDSRFPPTGIDDAVRAHYDRALAERRRVALTKRAEAAIAKDERLARALATDLERADDAEGLRKHGDLLLAHLNEVPRGAKSISLPDDFTDGSPLVISLDPALSARANAERFYKKHKRLSRARAKIAERLRELNARLQAARQSLAALASGQLPDEEPRPHGDESAPSGRRARGAIGSSTDAAARDLPYYEFRSSTGARIFVGKSAAKNDELTFRVARGADLWLHTRDVSGAHVVVPLAPGTAIDSETLVDAATLAAHHSSAKGEAQVDVTYTLKKHVRKARGAAGAVFTSDAKTLRVRFEPARIERLFAQRPVR